MNSTDFPRPVSFFRENPSVRHGETLGPGVYGRLRIDHRYCYANIIGAGVMKTDGPAGDGRRAFFLSPSRFSIKNGVMTFHFNKEFECGGLGPIIIGRSSAESVRGRCDKLPGKTIAGYENTRHASNRDNKNSRSQSCRRVADTVFILVRRERPKRKRDVFQPSRPNAPVQHDFVMSDVVTIYDR